MINIYDHEKFRLVFIIECRASYNNITLYTTITEKCRDSSSIYIYIYIYVCVCNVNRAIINW